MSMPASLEKPKAPQLSTTAKKVKMMCLCPSHPLVKLNSCSPTYPRIDTKAYGTLTDNAQPLQTTLPPLWTQPLPPHCPPPSIMETSTSKLL
ncbi:hypothetical protein C0989_003661, partial [Termitomyces sp. Mn162]